MARRLVEETSEGYVLTPRADVVLDAIQRLLNRSAEVDGALFDLQKGFDGPPSARHATRGALRYVSRIAWSEVVRATAVPVATVGSPPIRRLPVEPPATGNPSWLDPEDPREVDRELLSSAGLPSTAVFPRRRLPPGGPYG